MSEPIWLRPPTVPGVGRPAEWSREQITAAAIAVAERDGLVAVTMRRVAAELGTGSASLYRHLAHRGDLLDLMIDQALSEYYWPPVTADWRADIVAEHLRRLRYLRSRSWLADAVLIRPPRGPAAIRILERTLARLAGHPAGGTAKLEAVGVLSGLIQSHLRNERPVGGVLDPGFAAAQAALFARAAADGDHPQLAAVLADRRSATAESLDSRLGRILGLVVDGLLPTRCEHGDPAGTESAPRDGAGACSEPPRGRHDLFYSVIGGQRPFQGCPSGVSVGRHRYAGGVFRVGPELPGRAGTMTATIRRVRGVSMARRYTASAAEEERLQRFVDHRPGRPGGGPQAPRHVHRVHR